MVGGWLIRRGNGGSGGWGETRDEREIWGGGTGGIVVRGKADTISDCEG